MLSAEPPAAFYEHLGRMVTAAAFLEVQLAVAAHLATGQTGEDPWRTASRPGGAMRRLDQAVQATADPQASRLRQLRDDAEPLLTRRSRAVHSVLVLDFPTLPGEDVTWLQHHPRTRADHPLDLDDLRDLTRRLQALAARAVTVAVGSVAD